MREVLFAAIFVLAVVAPVLALTARREPPAARCVAAHPETRLQPVFTGKITVLVPMTYDVCDRAIPAVKP